MVKTKMEKLIELLKEHLDNLNRFLILNEESMTDLNQWDDFDNSLMNVRIACYNIIKEIERRGLGDA